MGWRKNRLDDVLVKTDVSLIERLESNVVLFDKYVQQIIAHLIDRNRHCTQPIHIHIPTLKHRYYQ